ncbi:electron transfer flavoprotein subunit alpha/FixB family protein [Desulfatiferula olefinivorans]
MADKADVTKHKGVWVFAEQQDGKLAKIALEMLGKGRDLADKLGVDLTAVLLGAAVKPLADDLVAYGADKVIVAEHPELAEYRTELYTKIVCEQADKAKPEVLIIGASPIGRDLTPRVSFRLNTGCTADCTELDIDLDERLLVSTRPAFGGNVMATIICPEHRPQMSTVRPGVFAVPEKKAGRTGEITVVDVTIAPTDINVTVLESSKSDKHGTDIQDAVKIVSVGLGASDDVSFKAIQEIASLIGAEVGGTRPCVEKVLIDHGVQIGQTGKNVRPELYMACGISGAVQHTTGISNAKYVVAINKDPNAEIFKFANVGIAGDAKQILTAIVKEIKAVQQK